MARYVSWSTGSRNDRFEALHCISNLHHLTPHSLHQCPPPQPFYTPQLGCCCCCYWVIFSHLCMYLGIYLYLLCVGITVESQVSFEGKLVLHILGCSPTVPHKHKPMCSRTGGRHVSVESASEAISHLDCRSPANPHPHPTLIPPEHNQAGP